MAAQRSHFNACIIRKDSDGSKGLISSTPRDPDPLRKEGGFSITVDREIFVSLNFRVKIFRVKNFSLVQLPTKIF